MARPEVTGKKVQIDDEQLLFTVGATARKLGRSVNTIYRMIHDDIIEALPLMGVLMIRAETIQDILEGKNERARGDDIQIARHEKGVISGALSAKLKIEKKAAARKKGKHAPSADAAA